MNFSAAGKSQKLNKAALAAKLLRLVTLRSLDWAVNKLLVAEINGKLILPYN